MSEDWLRYLFPSLAAVGGILEQVFRAPAVRSIALSSRIGALAMHRV